MNLQNNNLQKIYIYLWNTVITVIYLYLKKYMYEGLYNFLKSKYIQTIHKNQTISI